MIRAHHVRARAKSVAKVQNYNYNNVEIDYTGVEKRASQQIFSRRIEPTENELMEVPF